VSSALHATLDTLKSAAAADDAVVVFYSGGKDSLCVMDLCTRAFKRVVGVFMYLVPGLACVEKQLDFARQKWGVPILQYPHWVLAKCLADGMYCNNPSVVDDLELSLGDIYAAVRQDTGFKLIAHGAKKSDSLWRRRSLTTHHYENVIYPIVEWNKFDVMGYLKSHDIPLPDSSAGNATGIDLSTLSLLWLHDHHPQDFQALCKVFPYAPAAVHRRQWYGIGDSLGVTTCTWPDGNSGYDPYAFDPDAPKTKRKKEEVLAGANAAASE
jgi:sulfate adenylyltransferase subunit 2